MAILNRKNQSHCIFTVVSNSAWTEEEKKKTPPHFKKRIRLPDGKEFHWN